MTRAAPATLAARAIPAGIERFRADDRVAWLKRRQADVTASVAGALLGIHEYTTYYELFCLKAGLLPADSGESPALRRGRLLEDDALQVIAEDRPAWRVENCGFYYREPAARIGATPDAIAVDPERTGFGVIQVKSVEPGIFRSKWCSEDDEPTPPTWIVLQAVIEATLTGASWAAVAPIIVGHGLYVPVVPVPIHAGVMARLRAEVKLFWQRVESGDTPDPDFRRDGATIDAVYRDDNAQELDLTGDNHAPELCAELDGLLLARRDADDRIEAIKAELKHKLGHHESAVLADGRRITWRAQSRAMRFQPPTDSRVLRVGRPRSQENRYA